MAKAAASRGSSQDSELMERQPTLREQLSALTPQQMEEEFFMRSSTRHFLREQ